MELGRGLLVEHAYALFTDEGRPVRTQWVLHLSWPAVILTLLGGAWLIGFGLRAAVGVPPGLGSQARAFFLALMVFAIAWDGTQWWRTRRFPRPRHPVWLAVVALIVWFVCVIGLAWAEVGPLLRQPDSRLVSLHAVMNFYLLWVVVSSFLEALWPSERLLEALGRVEVAENELALARQWVAGCHEMAAKGIVSPLDDAEATVARWTAELAEARKAVAALGYRSRFLPSSAV